MMYGNIKRRNVFKITSHGFIQMVVSASVVYGATVDTVLPTNGVVKQGAINITSNSNTMNINQSTQKGIIEWGTFNIGKSATVNFNQPNSNSSTLNRVVSSNPSEIAGRLNANGQVFLINPNGILFSKTSKVDVGSLTASTMNISDENYLNSNYSFQREGSLGKIINEGELTANDKGYVALMAPEIINDGVIEAKLGNIAIGSGEQVILSFSNSELVNMEVSQAQITTLIENKNLIITEDGKVFLSAQSRDELLGSLITNSGKVEASGLISKNGEIYLDSTNSIEISGTLKAKDGKVYVGNQEVENTLIKNTATLEGKFVETSAKNLQVENGVTIKAKTWLLDPTDITITNGGVDGISGSNIAGATINTQLNNGTSVVLDAINNITINDNISKTLGTDATLTFKAGNNISMTAGKSITSTSNKLNLVLWANSDGNTNGRIEIGNSGSTLTTLTTNGGSIWMGGGSGSTTWNGLTVGNSYALSNTGSTISSSNQVNGISMLATNISTSGGDVAMYGDAESSLQVNDGIRLQYENTTASNINVGNGKIYLDGKTSSGGTYNFGLDIKGTQLTSTSTNSEAIKLVANSNTTGNDTGIVAGGTTISALNGGVSINIDVQNSSDSGWDPSSASTISAKDIVVTSDGKLRLDTTTITSTNLTTINAQNGIAIEMAASNSFKDLVISGTNGFTLNKLLGVTGLIDMSSSSGDITLSGNIVTTSTSNNAIIINAGKNTAAGTSTGGNIIHTSGTVSTGTNGRATLYSGSIIGSTGLTTLIGSGSGNFRYNSDETSTNYTTALSNGTYVIYREQPVLTVAPSTASSTYGNSVSISGVTGTITGYINGDSTSTTTGTATFTTTATNTSNAGSYNIAYLSGLSNSLGYSVVDKTSVTDEYTINHRPITLTVDSVSKIYGQINPSLTYQVTNGNLVNSDTLIGSLSTTATQYSNTGTYDVISTLANSNYAITFEGLNKLTINKANTTVTANSDTKTYNGQAQSVSGFSVTGLVNNETSLVLEGVSGDNATGINVGTYNTALTGTDENYNLTFIDGTLIIKQQELNSDHSFSLVDNIVSQQLKMKMSYSIEPTIIFSGSDVSAIFASFWGTTEINGGTFGFFDIAINSGSAGSTGATGPETEIQGLQGDKGDKGDKDVIRLSIEKPNYVDRFGMDQNIMPVLDNTTSGMKKQLQSFDAGNTQVFVNNNQLKQLGEQSSQSAKKYTYKMTLQGTPEIVKLTPELEKSGMKALSEDELTWLLKSGVKIDNLTLPKTKATTNEQKATSEAPKPTLQELKASGKTAKELKDSGVNLKELKELGYSLDELILAGYSLSDLKSAGVDLSKLKKDSVKAMKDSGYSLSDMKTIGFDAKELKDSGYSLKELKDSGVNLKELKELGYSLDELRSAGYSLSDLKSAGVDLSKLKKDSVKEMKDSGYSLSDMKTIGFDAKELKDSGYSLKELKDSGFSASELKKLNILGGFLKIASTPLKDAGFSAKELKDAGFKFSEIFWDYKSTDLGKLFTIKEVAASFPASSLVYFGYTKDQFNEDGIKLKDLCEGADSNKILSLSKAGYSAKEFLDAGISLAALISAGIDVTAFKQGTPKQLLDKGYTFSDLAAIGFKAKELKDAGYSLDVIKKNGCPIRDLKAFGFSLAELKKSGYLDKGTFSDLAAIGFKAKELKDAGYSLDVLKENGCSISDLKAFGFGVAELKKSGYLAKELQASGFSVTELKNANYTLNDMGRLYSLAELRGGGYTAKDFLDNYGYASGSSIDDIYRVKKGIISASQNKVAGYYASEFVQAGFSVKDVIALGFQMPDLQTAGFSAKQVAEAGGFYTKEDLEYFAKNHSSWDQNDMSMNIRLSWGASYLKAVGLNIQDTIKLGGSDEYAKSGGYTASEFKSIGKTASDLKKLGFTDQEIKDAGF